MRVVHLVGLSRQFRVADGPGDGWHVQQLVARAKVRDNTPQTYVQGASPDEAEVVRLYPSEACWVAVAFATDLVEGFIEMERLQAITFKWPKGACTHAVMTQR